MAERLVRVEHAGGVSEVVVGRGVLASIREPLGALAAKGARRVFVVHDSGVPTEHLEMLQGAAKDAGLAFASITITPTETVKSIETYGQILVEILRHGHTRLDPVVALGGGIVGDLGGFAAASVLRGVPVIQCPTTLLAMVDASVGGKTGFNLAVPNDSGSTDLLKNMVGAFHQPVRVIADLDVLDSLDPRVRRAGLAECVKHAMISASVGDGSLLDWTLAHLDPIASGDPGTMVDLVHKSVLLKGAVVERDEREDPSARAGGRMLLNLGHTFGHAIETIPGLSPDPSDPGQSPLQHGEAVALGMVAAFRCALRAGRIEKNLAEELELVLSTLGLPARIGGLPGNASLIDRMRRDKKAGAGSIRLILPEARGRCSIVETGDTELIGSGFDAIRV